MPTLALLRLGTHAVATIDPDDGTQKVAFLGSSHYPPGYSVEHEDEAEFQMPAREERAAKNSALRNAGLAPHGWNLEEAYNAETGETEFFAERLHATARVAQLPGTDLQLPMRVSVLYQIGERGKADASIPPEVANANVLVNITTEDEINHLRSAPAGKFFTIKKLGEVHTYELPGGIFKLSMPAPDADGNPVQDPEQTLALYSHGADMKEDIGLPESTDVGVFGPPSRRISALAIPDLELRRLYATLRSEGHVSSANLLAPQAKAATNVKAISGTSKPDHMVNMELAKIGRVTQPVQKQMENDEVKEFSGAAGNRDRSDKRAVDFLVYRTKMHLLTVRKDHRPSAADVIALKEELKTRGLHYENLWFHNCRSYAEQNLSSAYVSSLHDPTAADVREQGLTDIRRVMADGRLVSGSEASGASPASAE